jgi:DNA-binding phage protein
MMQKKSLLSNRSHDDVTEKAAMPRESLYRALGPCRNPTIKTLLAVLNASGLHLSVARQH